MINPADINTHELPSVALDEEVLELAYKSSGKPITASLTKTNCFGMPGMRK